MQRYAEDSGKRLAVLRTKDEAWFEGETVFFDVKRSRVWVLTRRIAHTAASSRTTDGYAADAWARPTQQLWPYG